MNTQEFLMQAAVAALPTALAQNGERNDATDAAWAYAAALLERAPESVKKMLEKHDQHYSQTVSLSIVASWAEINWHQR